MQTVILIILALSFLFTVSFLVENIVYEKEHGLTEMMRCMGADTVIIWLSWVISTLPQVTGSTVIGSSYRSRGGCSLLQATVANMINTALLFTNGAIFRLTSISVVFVLLTIYAFSVIAMAFLLSSL
ncbi:hypothetical protein ANCDUO_09068 [Ancylostoma duodenale]|uniref:Sodium/calcium exchanger membrane region domain-containing protein n=1 Tax=Ancylostoma duodenale TaxID=51022 RepID=A0A0C2GU04_9BILA|nr:hypothetical protein ANCDUO_09068 [Ancylostoma duodenale]